MQYKRIFILCELILIREISSNYQKSKEKNSKFQIDYISSSKGVIVDNLNDHLYMTHLIKVKQQKQHSILEMSPTANYTIQMYIEISDGTDIFHEVSQKYDENRFVLESHPKSDIYHYRKPLKSIKSKYCKHPLPRQYNIIMDTYKNRVTLAYSSRCNSSQSSFCSNDNLQGFSSYTRSINHECLWMKNGSIAKTDDNFEQLDENLNSIYCTENSPLLNSFFNENIDKTETFVSYTECETAKARCIDCLMLKCRPGNFCCQRQANCLLRTSCLMYYNTSCYQSYDGNLNNKKSRCMKGSTYKFTLIPEFYFNAEEFQCYLKNAKVQPKIMFTLRLIDRNSKIDKLKPIKFGGEFPKSNVLKFQNLEIDFIPSLIGSMDKIIFDKRRFEYFIYSLKSPSEFEPSNPEIHSLFSKSYIKVQMSKPFLHNTETWSTEKCQLNISGIYKAQTIFDPSTKIPVEISGKPSMIHQDENDIFSYRFIPKGLDNQKIQIRLAEKSSLLSLYFCRDNKLAKPINIKISIENIHEETWKLSISGQFTESIAFFTLSISKSFNPTNYFYRSDIIVTNSKPQEKNNHSNFFTISFNLSNIQQSINKTLILFLIDFQQCEKHIYRKLIFINLRQQKKSMNPNKETDQSVDISNFILIVFLATICICFFYFLLLAFQAARRSTTIRNSKTDFLTNKRNTKMNYRLFMKIIFYMTIKLFYTVSFTLSLVLSVCLSLNVFTIPSISQSNNNNDMISNRPILNNGNSNSEKSAHICNDSPKLISKNFLLKIKNQLNSQEIVRSISSQSIQLITIQIIENISFPIIQESVRKFFNSHQNFFHQQFLLILNTNVNIYKQLNQSQWLTMLRNWNVSSTENFLVYSDYFPHHTKKDYLRITNLLEIYELSNLLQSWHFLSSRLGNAQNQFKVSMKPNYKEFTFNTSLKFGTYRRYFHIHLQQTMSNGNASIINNKFDVFNKSLDFLTIDIFKIRLVFMLIDTALILYRCYWTYLDIRQMWNPKKQFIHLNQIILKTNHNSTNVRTKSSIFHWTKHHHLECLVSAHLAIAAIIILLSIICMNLLVLLTSRDHSHWLSRKAGNNLRMRSIKDIKEELSKFNNDHINPVHRQWQNQKISRIKQFMGYRKEAINRIMYFELFLNHQYLYELCGLQNLSFVPKWSLDFCQSLVPNHIIIPDMLCDRSLNYVHSLSFDFSSYITSKSIIYIYQPLYLVLNVLAILLFATSVVGILKAIRKSLEHKIFSSGTPNHIFLKSQSQMIQANFKDPKTLLQMKKLSYIPNVYSSNLEPPNQYQCKNDSFIETANTSV